MKGPSGAGSSSSLDSLSSTSSTSSFIAGHIGSQPTSLSISVNDFEDEENGVEEQERNGDAQVLRFKSASENHSDEREYKNAKPISSPPQRHSNLYQNSSNHHSNHVEAERDHAPHKDEPKSPSATAFSSNLTKFQIQAAKDQQQLNFQRNRSLSPPPPPPTKPSHSSNSPSQQQSSPIFKNKMHVSGSSPIAENNNVVGYHGKGKQTRDSPEKNAMTMSPTGGGAMGVGNNLKEKYPPINKVLPTPKQSSPIRDRGDGSSKPKSPNHGNASTNGVSASVLSPILNEASQHVLLNELMYLKRELMSRITIYLDQEKVWCTRNAESRSLG